jgi:hypothetical protein
LSGPFEDPEFPENRENNREFPKFQAVSAVPGVDWRRLTLQLQGVASNSLFCQEQGIVFAGTGNFAAGTGN